MSNHAIFLVLLILVIALHLSRLIPYSTCI